ncbi:broad-complex core protein isoforms 1/2/3/4/5 isoform X1 [Ostrinia furnacalis]|uniref:broad-complex core protein isoforms 1/2/3/4/5 isoform X1 n=2 Tax=Ostrinia furnacalis TaxID=93504 RepID=UPI00103E069B|nr:broad-complex core protein isoforms 1/2/3/4/5 isoform X1 [Ostrinia furnacalis]
MDDDEIQQFSLRWHKHQNSVIGALGRMLSTGALTDVTLSASGTSVKAHRLVLASCSQYFAQLFKELDTENNTVVVVLGCEAAELRLLLTFMYTGEVTASKKILPSLLRLAQTLKVSGLTDADTNSTLTPTDTDATPETEQPPSPVNLELKSDQNSNFIVNENSNSSSKLNFDDVRSPTNDIKDSIVNSSNDFIRNEKDRLSKLDQIVQNLYSTHKIGNPTVPVSPTTNAPDTEPYDRKWRLNSSVCTICHKRLSNQYNLRVHMDTHAGRRHACAACSHVSRSRDALRKHVAYRRVTLSPFL